MYSTTDTMLSFPDAEESVLRRLLDLNAFRQGIFILGWSQCTTVFTVLLLKLFLY